MDSPLSRVLLTSCAMLLVQTGCSIASPRGPQASPPSSVGSAPLLPPPQHKHLATLNIAEAAGGPEGAIPAAASGLAVRVFAAGLNHPRWLYTLPNGDVLVAETNAPPRPDGGKGIRGAIMRWVQGRAGAGSASANRILLLRDGNGDGVAEFLSVFVDGLNSPYGMALVGSTLYVANTDGIVKFAYRDGQTRIAGPATAVTDLPAGPLNHHWTKNIVASRDGTRLYATVGSNSNASENGLGNEEGRAAIWEVDLRTGDKRLFAAVLGLVAAPDGMFIGEHGSWNRSVLAGYRVVFVPSEAGHPSGPPRDILTAFVSDSGAARGRPVGVAQDGSGALLVADDVGNRIWRVVGSGLLGADGAQRAVN